MFVHYFDPHNDYLRHPRFGLAPERAGRLDGTQGIEQVRSMHDLTPEEIGKRAEAFFSNMGSKC